MNLVNYDAEYDKLRRIIQSIINDILSETEPTLQMMLLQNLGELSIFFGRKDTIDNLIPLTNSCFNKKDFMLRVCNTFYLYNVDGMLKGNSLSRLKSRIVNPS